MQSKKTLTLTAAAVAVPLLVGCGQSAQPSQSAEAGETTAQAQQTATTAASAQSSQAPAAGSGAASTADPAATTTGETTAQDTAGSGTTLPEVTDPLAGADAETARIPVEHPKYGDLEIVTYLQITSGGAAPSEGVPSYAVYQNGHPVGYVSSPEGTKVVNFSDGKALAGQTWEVGKDHPVDRYGNVYISYDTGLTVLTPTDKGFDSQGTMPPAEDAKFPFSHASLKLDAAGQPTVIQRVVDKDGTETGKTVNWTWENNTFVQEK
ncbi:hypothetical protein [Kocuria varians]|uniref:Lipoprotein n=1 Tax=Kocuria varians TaxID=1272 RepID=A0A7D7KZ10_KOCVA|nr:hypothetical protein [Kocuria varians]QMS55775.1 hypothetical protein CIB50_0000468 [Kocuria varians]